MYKRTCIITLVTYFLMFIFFFSAEAATTTTTAGTKPFFNPMVQILLDATPTMNSGPLGYTSSRFGADKTCAADTTVCTGSATVSGKTYSCAKGFCPAEAKNSNCKTDCSRLAIAQRAVFKVLDYDGNGIINKYDKENWKLILGASTYNFLDGYVEIADVTSDLSYQQIVCGDSTSCAEADMENIINDRVNSNATYKCKSTPCLMQVSTNAGTNLVQALGEAKTTFDTECSSGDNACRSKYVLLLTDGSDNKAYYTKDCYNTACKTDPPCTIKARTGSGSSGKDCDVADAFKWRREMVLKAKDLATANYKLYVVGFSASGGLPDYLENTLNWMALWGDTASYDLTETTLAAQELYTTAAIRPSNILINRTSACLYTDSATETVAECVVQGDVSDTTYTNLANFLATKDDPGNTTTAKFSDFRTEPAAHFVKTPSAVATSLKGILGAVFSDNYSFTQSSLQAVRDESESYVYESSYESVLNDSFWIGHLKRHQIYTTSGTLADGTTYKAGDIKSTPDWDAGTVLQSRADADTTARSIQTYIGGAQVDFTTDNVKAYLDVGGDATIAGNIVSFFRSGESVTDYPMNDWKLGDISGSSPLTIGTPNALFSDQWDKSYPKAFDLYRTAHTRTTAAKNRLILQGANDGQMHAFRTSDGKEVWSFIPSNMLPKLKLVAHNVHPPVALYTGTTLSHQLFVNGPTRAAEIWIDAGSKTLCSKDAEGVVTCGATMTKLHTAATQEWRTYFILSEGEGAADTLWSSSTSCQSGFSTSYDATTGHTNYCGIWAFDISATTTTTENTSTAPTFKWRIGKDAGVSLQTGNHLGRPWSKMFIGRVRESNKEKWVGLMGGGYSGGQSNPCPNAEAKECSATEAPGKGFFVISMGDKDGTTDGKMLWQATHNAYDASGTASVSHAAMDYDLAAPIAAIDSDNDGFLDVAYAPDTGGNVWRFKFCTAKMDADPTSPCTTSNWSTSLLFDSSTGAIRPIYTSVSVSRDPSGQLWVYFGTGDKTDASASNAQEYFFAIKDSLSNTVSWTNTLQDVTDSYYTNTESKPDGWYIKFTGGGEKVLADPVVFEGNVYFATYVPRKTGASCTDMGASYIYGVNYMTGKGVFTNEAEDATQSKKLGDGLVTGLFASRGDGIWNLYGSLSGGKPHIINIPDVPSSNAANNSLLYWQDRRIR